MNQNKEMIECTRRWISSMVIGLNLCPFAEKVFDGDKIRYFVCESTVDSDVLKDLAVELELLASIPIEKMETSLMLIPHALAGFLDFNDFLADADELIGELGLRGTIQIAGFHPEYQFAGTQIEAAENYTNRSPYPMLHLLREASITAVAAEPEELLEIPKRNIELLNKLGTVKILERLTKDRAKTK